MTSLSVILATTTVGQIGLEFNNENDNKPHRILIHSSIDQDHFANVTKYSPDGSSNLVIVGRKTWETLPPVMRNCARRKYVVLTRQVDYKPVDELDVKSVKPYVYHDWDKAIEFCSQFRSHKVFVIGGAEIYKLAFASGFVTEVFLTEFYLDLETLVSEAYKPTHVKYSVSELDRYVTSSKQVFDSVRLTVKVPDGPTYNPNSRMEIVHYKRRGIPYELQYLDLLKDIYSNGEKVSSRNGTVLSVKDRSLKIDLNDGFPILTLRKSFWRGIKAELLWMLSGSTDTKVLSNNGVHIWDQNSTRELLDKAGLSHLSEGDIGPGYGFQFRYSGAKYVDSQTNYKGQGVDQLTQCINLIKTDPNSRRNIINLWSVPDVDQTALPPCHYSYQFTVSQGKLSCHLYQRSWDVLLGWNTSTAALLTHLLAHYCDLGVGTLTHTVCDAHMYELQLEAYQKLKNRVPFKLPTLRITGEKPRTIDGYLETNLELTGYQHHDPIDIKFSA